MSQVNHRSYHVIRSALLDRQELALLDVREEDPFAQAHPLFAANVPLSRLELEIFARVPRRDTPITVYDDGEGLAPVAAQRLQALGYTDVALLEGGLAGWRDAGGELFKDVNVPSKAFGELVEAERHTPSLAAEEVKTLLDANADVVVLDARRFDEYQTMSIPGGISVPGAELVLRVAELAPNPATRVIVNCAGRTRSIIGTQSLVNAGIPNPVSALRNGTIGWTLAGQALEHGQTRRFGAVSNATRVAAAQRARQVADRAGVARIDLEGLHRWQAETLRTTYLFDVRTPEEFALGHLPGARSTPGGQLVQETDHVASVRGARLVLVDDDGTRANMSASWLAQMGWEVAVLDGLSASDFKETGAWVAPVPVPPQAEAISPATLVEWLEEPGTQVLDFTTSANHVRQHIPGAVWALRSQLQQVPASLPGVQRYVVTCGSSQLARYAAPEVAALSGKPVFVLEGGNSAWNAAGLPTAQGEQHLGAPRIDRYRRPYEGTDNPREAMQGYLDWEFGLVAQLGRDGTHGFFVV
ncbi:rhodanese-related sulfurtransferase [Pseudomonas sp. MWU13-3659]|uniref:rhodanese-related sulfurtransferase n=1 Tax=Pseudomonas sp. MWU13-3659 TaxID=2986964 RepID=UPI0020753C76|nr:rhodanese-related sulfurtransferase [Pseudomonas sp. MWU13-3659]